MQPVKVYAVIAGYNCEGEVFDTLRLFDCLSTAEAYKTELAKKGADYVLLDTREVCMKSALCAA